MSSQTQFAADIDVAVRYSAGMAQWTISFFAPSSALAHVQSMQAIVKTSADDALSLRLDRREPWTDDMPKILDLRVYASSESVDIGSIVVVLGADEIEEFVRAIDNACQSAFIRALRTARVLGGEGVFETLQPAAVTLPATVAQQEGLGGELPQMAVPAVRNPGWFKRHVTAGRLVTSFLMLVAGALIVQGLLPSAPAQSDPFEAANRAGGYSDMQAQIRNQIAAAGKANNGGLGGGLQGQTIAIDTMKAMGLDPGKANAGCLVGVRK